VDYDIPLTDSLRFDVATGMQYTSRYNFSDALRPDAFQPGYTRWDASVRLHSPSAGWELALVGRNLTNKLVVTSANDMPRQGGGTGAPIGSLAAATAAPGDLNAIVERGREVHLEFSYKF
jgi:outer membrane receptor protein involved in Fe transport